MRSEGAVKHFAFAFVIALVLYFGMFAWIQHRRAFKGPWEITFASDETGKPTIAISQPYFHIAEKITFPGQTIKQTAFSQAQRFEIAVTNLPFGEMVFQDPTFLPGTVTMRLFGHEIELLPRVLIVDKKEIPWRAGETVAVP